MAELKTRPNDASVAEFIAREPDAARRADCHALIAMMRELSGAEPRLWGPAIVGFGSQPLRYASGRELEWPLVAFSPRKRDLTLYLGGETARRAALLAKLGKHATSKACLYIKRLADVDQGVLRALIAASLPSARAAARKPRNPAARTSNGTARRAPAKQAAARVRPPRAAASRRP